MLVLQGKPSEVLLIGDAELTFSRNVRVAINAPRDVRVGRRKIEEQRDKESTEAPATDGL